MNKTGPIVIIEDDVDDQHILTEIFKELNYANKIIFVVVNFFPQFHSV